MYNPQCINHLYHWRFRMSNNKTTSTGKVPDSHIECEAFRNDILEYTGDIFCSRPVVLFRQRPGVFGCKSVKKDRLRRYTLHNGILNQCSISSDGKPSVYWVVMDAMIHMKKKFTKKQVVDMAVETLVDYDGKCSSKNMKKSCVNAFYILKTHLSHPSRKKMGFGFIVEPYGRKKRSHYFLRARTLHEQGKAVVEEEERPLASIMVNERAGSLET